MTRETTHRRDERHWDAGRVWVDTGSYEGYAYTCGGCGYRSPDHNEVTRHIANERHREIAQWNREQDALLARMHELAGRIRRKT